MYMYYVYVSQVQRVIHGHPLVPWFMVVKNGDKRLKNVVLMPQNMVLLGRWS